MNRIFLLACSGLFLVLMGLFRSAPSASNLPPLTIPGEDDRKILQSFLKHADAAVKEITPEKMRAVREVEQIAWVHSKYLDMQLAAYQLTGERKYLDNFVRMTDALLTRLSIGPDGYLGFRGVQYAIFQDKNHPNLEDDVVITDFTVIQVLCDFAEIVRAQKALKAAYGQKVTRYLDIAQNHLFKKWEGRKQYVDLGKEGAVYRESTRAAESRKNLTHPHNKQSKCCRALLALYRVTGKDEYFRRAVKLGVRFKRTLRLDGELYRWHYWDPAGEWDRKADHPQQWKHWIGAEHRAGYHNLTVEMADALYDHGVVFDRTDMQRFVNTQMQVCWNGSLDEPVFKRTDGTPDEQTFVASALAGFEPKIAQFFYGERRTVERLKNKEHPWRGGVEASNYLRGKYVVTLSSKPMRTNYRTQFEKNPANAKSLRDIESTAKPKPAD